VVASNGPLMGRRLLAVGQLTRRTLLTTVALAGLAGAGLAAAITSRRGRSPVSAGTVAGAIGAGTVPAALLRRWQPCGEIVRDGLRTTRTFDDEGPQHAHLARTGPGFAGVVIGDGHPPADALAGMGGLIRLVRGGAVESGPRGTGPLRAEARPAVGWGLWPTDDGDGCLVLAGGHGADERRARVTRWRSRGSGLDVRDRSRGSGLDLGEPSGRSGLDVARFGRRSGPDVRRLGELLVELGVIEAVATDPSGCAMLIARGRHLVRRPPWHRRAMQCAGLCCGPG
jgi:hypothetical protein